MAIRYGMTIPLGGLTAREQFDTARALSDLGYTDLWSSEVAGTDCFTPLAIAATATGSVRLGTAIAPVFTRGTACLAQSAATLAALAPGRTAVGIGTSSATIVQEWNGVRFTKPYQRARDTIRFLRQAFAGERVDADYETFSVHGFRLDLSLETAPPIYLAALREQMLRLAGRQADGAIVNWLSSEDMSRVCPLVLDGQRATDVIVRLIVIPTEDRDRARAIGRWLACAYLNVPAYAGYQRWLGRGEKLEKMWQLWRGGERADALDAIPDDVVDELFVHGSPAACREHIERYRWSSGVTPVLAIQDVGRDPMELAKELAPR